MDRLVIIDGNSLINRAYYAIQRPMMTKDGIYTQGIYGFLSMLSKIRTDYEPTHMLVAFDRKAPTFRHLEYSDYKAGRKKMPTELAMQLPILKDVLKAMGIAMFEIDGFEADDIIGTTAKMSEDANLSAVIITGDKDALQLATDKTSVVITKKGITEFKLYDDAAMKEEYGFDHIQFIDYKALRGDTSDNVPGIEGVGEKTAMNLVNEFGSIDNLLAHVDEVKSEKLRNKVIDGKTQLAMSKKLVTIVTNVPVDFTIDDLKLKPQNDDELIDLYTKLEFKTHLARLLKSGNVTKETAIVKDEELKAPDLSNLSISNISEDELSKLLDGEITIDIECDDNHVGKPVLSSVQIYKDGKCYVCDANALAAFNGKHLKLNGFRLGRLYYALFANGIDASNITTGFDSSIARYVLSPSIKAQELETILLETFHVSVENKQEQMSLFDTSQNLEGIAKKLVLLDALKDYQAKEIEKEELNQVYYDIELPLCKVLAKMEAMGFKVDGAELTAFGKKLKNMIASLEDEIYDMANMKFNINSPKQLGEVLFDKLQIPYAKKTTKGYSTSAEVLEKLADDYPIVAKVLEYRTYAKLNSTYVEGLLPLIGADGKVHAHFQQTVTATGRISCTEPNLQNIPVRQELGRQLRKVFTSDSSDYVLIGADYSQIELRVMAHLSKDENLIEAFNSGRDIHKETAAKVFGVKPDRVTPQMRSNAKAVNFGVIYGMSSFGLAGEISITRKEAEKYISDYFKKFSGVKSFMDEQIAKAKTDGYVRTLYGRKRAIPEINASAFMVRQLGERLAMNTPVQGTAADIIKIAMNKVYDALEKECKDSHLILQIHDELIIQARRDEADKAREILKDSMENACALLVKLEIADNTADNWFDLK
ncbi:MAG: DNA polymerase I [Clostridia bacterium]|nr:DNA polymerase I [Clostridia bacterium]